MSYINNRERVAMALNASMGHVISDTGYPQITGENPSLDIPGCIRIYRQWFWNNGEYLEIMTHGS